MGAEHSIDSSDELLRARLRVYTAWMAGFTLAVIAIVTGVERWYGWRSAWLSSAAGHVYVGAALALWGAFALLHVRAVPRSALYAIDVVVTLIVPVQTSFSILSDVPNAAMAIEHGLWVPTVSQELKSSLAIAHLLLLRAAVVPSHPGRTALLGVLATAPLWWSTHVAYGQTAIAARHLGMPLVTIAFWTLFSIALSTMCSSVIYGLRRQVHDAMRMGQYQLERKIGQGGMGVVYRARHVLLRRPTAIKVLAMDRIGHAALARFEREVQLTAKLSHPNIVSVYDFGRTQDGTFYYAMELLDGVDLQQLVDGSGAQPAARVQLLLRQAAQALAEAHAVSLIHRDIKPANMILTQRASESDVLKLVDFGLVKEQASNAELTQSQTHSLRGTPLYMAPEAILAPETVGPRSDLYALGAVGYFLLTGQPVFEGKTAFAVLGHHAHSTPTPPSDRTEGVPAKLEAVLLRCLEKDPERRYADAQALCRALDECDDVAPWTQASAQLWWKERLSAPSEPASTSTAPDALTVDLSTRKKGTTS